VNVSPQSGTIFREKWASRGAAFGDLDNDGDVDVVVATCGGPAYVLRNEGGNRNNWIGLDLLGTRSNRDAIGAEVKLTAGSGHVQYGMVTTAGSYQSAQPKRLLFGIGKEETIQKLEIHWPSGTQQKMLNPAIRKVLAIVEK
jgi:hypothetical protein